MLYLLTTFSDGGGFFNLFRYITFRAGGAFFTALLFGFLFGPPLINLLRTRQKHGQPIREDGPESHKIDKAGTPTMGGVRILGAVITSSVLWARPDIGFVWLILVVTLSFGLIGFTDDYQKVTKNNHSGVSGKVRLLAGFVIAAIAAYWATMLHPEELQNQLAIPVTSGLWYMGFLFLPFAMIVIVGSAKAVNLSVGLDGLAIMPVMIAAGTLGVIAYFVGRVDFSSELGLTYVPGAGEILLFVAALIGGGLGFLWYNGYPAQIFMGDTGSLSLGGVLGTSAILLKKEFLLAIVGGVFVAEALSVIFQVLSFRFRKGKRIFLCSPLHHHFEYKGWPEMKVVLRFWIIGLFLAIIGLASLKFQ